MASQTVENRTDALTSSAGISQHSSYLSQLREIDQEHMDAGNAPLIRGPLLLLDACAFQLGTVEANF
jgi:hypothetical protein